jgi:hypothetical protein
MKRTRWSYGAVLLVACALSMAWAMPPRKDINPAVLYLQAFSLFPELDESQSKLLGHETAGDVTAEERDVAMRFDAAFALIVRARTQNAPCDWGMDPADGPNAITPQWTKIRTATYAAVLRARVALADGEQARARDELLAASVLSRHAAAGATLVGTMIQVAAEMKILDFMAMHFDELKPQTRSELAAGLQAPPLRATVAEAMVNEKSGFQDWLLDKLEDYRAKEHDDTKVLALFSALMNDTFKSESDLANRIIEASGGTSAGVIRYIKTVGPHYARAEAIAKASASDINREKVEFEKEINATTNLLARIVIPNAAKARRRELEFEERLNRLPNAAP